MNMLVSIIVPVYNVELYIGECVKSLINQSYKDIEILLIDDGSTDDSLRICNMYKDDDSRIKVYSKENEGLGLTRNYGIERSRGQYICFVDSDDYLLPDAITSMIEVATKTNADIISANTIYKEKPMDVLLDEGLYDKQMIYNILLYRIMGNYPGKVDAYTYTATAKMYKSSLFDKSDVRFPSERKLVWEDLVFSTALFPRCDSIYVLKKPVYYYRYNSNSLTHKYSPNKFQRIIELYRYMQKKISDIGLREEAMIRLANNFIGHIRTCIKLEVFYARQNGYKLVRSQISNICNNNVTKEIIEYIPENSYNTAQRLYNFCIKHKLYDIIFFLTWLQNKKKRID